jgi:glycosyltransferase involved in cell wall biosynthesis
MNVAIAIDELDMGGAQHVVYELVTHLDKFKYRITIICTDGKVGSLLEKRMIKESTEQNYSIIFLPKHNFIKIHTSFIFFNKIYNKLKRIFLDLVIIFELSQELSKVKPDIVHAHQHGIWAVPWTILHRIPIVTTVHTNPKVTFSRETEGLLLKLSLLLRRNVLVGISAYNRELIRNYWHLSCAYARYVNNGIEINNYTNKAHKIFTFINVSRQDENKNQSLILKALSRLYNEDTSFAMKLFLVGDGVTHNALKKTAKDLHIEHLVDFTGYVDSAAEYLAVSDVYISSSHREGLPLSVLEAMAANLPVIATDVGGVKDLAQENGILIDDDDENGLYLAMKKLRDNDELRLFKGRKSREMVRNYSVESMTQGYSLLYDELAKKR